MSVVARKPLKVTFRGPNLEILQRLIKTLIEWLKDIVTQIMTGGGVIDIDKYAEASGPGVVALQEKIRRKTPLYLQFSVLDTNVKKRISFKDLTGESKHLHRDDSIAGMRSALFQGEPIPANILWTLYAIKKKSLSASPLPYITLNNQVVVPNGITMIEPEACVSVHVVTVSFPPSLEIIREAAFDERVSLTNIDIPPDGNLKKICRRAFRSCSTLTAVTLPKKLEVIESEAFSGCTALTTVTILSAEDIQSQAFQDCQSLTSLQLPDNLKNISDHAFWGCPKLEEVTLPAALESIGQFAFRSCTSLKTVKYRMEKPLNKEAFEPGVVFNKVT